MLVVVSSDPAITAECIGVATMVKRQLTGTIGGQTSTLILGISSGDGVFHREVIAADAGGRAQPSTYTIKTPVATIGVRGTIFSGNVVSPNYMTLKLQKGLPLICPERGKRNEGNNNCKRSAEGNQANCVLVEPGDFSIGSGVSLPPAGDPGVIGTEPNEPLDLLDPPVQCIFSFGRPICS